MQQPIEPGIYLRGYRAHFRPDDPDNPFRALYDEKRRLVLDWFGQRERSRVLDAGGGYGRLAGPLSKRHDVTLCDISDEMVDEARRRWPKLDCLVADARNLPFDDDVFDVVVAVDLLAHLPDLGGGLAELARVARPGGPLLFDTSNASPWWVLAYPSYIGFSPARLVRTLRGRGVLPEWQTLVRHDREEEVRTAAAAVGVELERLDPLGPRWSPKWHLWWGRAP